MKIGLYILLFPFVLLFLYGCNVRHTMIVQASGETGSCYEIVIRVSENENSIGKVMDVLMKNQLIVLNIQEYYLAQQQIEYRVTGKQSSGKKIDEIKDELFNQRGVMSIDIKRKN